MVTLSERLSAVLENLVPDEPLLAAYAAGPACSSSSPLSAILVRGLATGFDPGSERHYPASAGHCGRLPLSSPTGGLAGLLLALALSLLLLLW